jgi:hypothetical protein
MVRPARVHINRCGGRRLGQFFRQAQSSGHACRWQAERKQRRVPRSYLTGKAV